MFKNFPLRNHRFAYKAALAALAAHRQDRFWDFHDLLFQNSSRLNDQKIQEISTQLGLNQDRFRRDLEDPQLAAMIRQDMADGARAGIKGTPSVFVNGKMIGAMSSRSLEEAVETALEKKEDGAGKKD